MSFLGNSFVSALYWLNSSTNLNVDSWLVFLEVLLQATEFQENLQEILVFFLLVLLLEIGEDHLPLLLLLLQAITGQKFQG